VPDELKRAWDIVSHTPMEAGRTLGKPLSAHEMEFRLEGILQAQAQGTFFFFDPPDRKRRMSLVLL
jgi:hypothetical protein